MTYSLASNTQHQQLPSGDHTQFSLYNFLSNPENTVIGNTQPPTQPPPSGGETQDGLIKRALTRTGMIDGEGQLFGLGDNTLQGLGTLGNMGAGLFNMYNANRMYGLTKDNFRHQKSLQNEQAQAARAERERINRAREGLVAHYTGSNKEG